MSTENSGAQAAPDNVLRGQFHARPIPIIPFASIELKLEDDEHLVEGILPVNGVAFLWGKPKTGKTGMAIDQALHIATGKPWHGKTVKAGPVLYVAAEGHRGISKRIAAWSTAHLECDDSPVPFYLIPRRLDLVKQAQALIDTIKAGKIAPKLIVIDTLNKTLNGSESDDKVMNAYLSALSKLREEFDCLVLVLHHCGHGQDRMRGHSSILGDMDVELALERAQGGVVTMTVAASRDEESGETLAWKSESIMLGRTKSGRAVTSFVLQPLDDHIPAPAGSTKLSDKQHNALKALFRCIADIGQPLPASFNLPGPTQGVTADQWKEELFRAGDLDREASNPRTDFARVKKQLKSKSKVAERDGLTWPV